MNNMNKTEIAKKYFHVDNGGTTFKVERYTDENGDGKFNQLVIEDGYYGYSVNTMTLVAFMEKPNNLRELALFLLQTADKLDENP